MAMNITRCFIALSAFLLGLGLIAPTLTIYPKAGELTWLIEILAPEELETSTYSIIGVIGKLYQLNDVFLALLLCLFSVMAPVSKLTLYWQACSLSFRPKEFNRLLKAVHYVGKFSMAEVFTIALIIVVVKSFPGGSTAQLEWGAYVFTASVACSIIASIGLEKKG